MNNSQVNYKNGFARSRGESANPGLWDGLYAAYAPILGATGTELRNQIGGPSAGMVNMAPGDDWVAHGGKIQLDLDGTSDYLTTSPDNVPTGIGTGDYTWCAHVELRALGTSYRGVCANGNYSPGFMTRLTSGNWGMYHGANRDSGQALSTGVAYSLAVSRRLGGYFYFWENGIETNPDPRPGTSTHNVSNNYFQIGTSSTISQEIDGYVGYVYCYNRAITENQIRQIHKDPWAPWRLKSRLISYAPAAAGGFEAAWAANSNAVIQGVV